MSSSLTPSASRISLVKVFEAVPDPRDPRGVRHRLPVILACAAAAVVAGAKTWVAMQEWVAEVDREALSALGIRPQAEPVKPVETAGFMRSV